VLVHHADAGGDGVRRRTEAVSLVVEQDLALVGPVEPEEDVHERGLARPVLAEQGVDLSAVRGEVHAVARHDAGEPLRDAPELDFHVVVSGSSIGPVSPAASFRSRRR
jgi:hypothetical protein